MKNRNYVMNYSANSRKMKSGIIILTGLILLVFSVGFFTSCSGGPEKSLNTPRGVVNTFISRVLDDGNLKGAYELLSEPDQRVIAQSPEFYDFIMGKHDPQYVAYYDIYDQLSPDVRGWIKKLVRFNAREGKEKEGYVEVGLEISYPSDYMTLGMTMMGIGARLQQKYNMARLDSIPKEERDKIIWSIKNDLNKAVDNINVDKTSTYIFPVKMVQEEGAWKIDLDLEQRQGTLGM
jgi:hypothetical protein